MAAYPKFHGDTDRWRVRDPRLAHPNVRNRGITVAQANSLKVGCGSRAALRVRLPAARAKTDLELRPGVLLKVSAGLGSLKEDWENAAVLFGAAEAQTARTGLRRDPADEVFLAPLVARARAASEAAFSAGDAVGRALTNDAAMEKVRASLERSSPAA